MTEIWKAINGFDGYEVSNYGQVRVSKTGLVLKHNLSQRGHHAVGLFKDGKHYSRFVHKLVAEAFIPNPKHLPQINHKDEDKGNNRVENLEWCTARYNLTYNGLRERAGQTNRDRQKGVEMLNKDGEVLRQFNSVTDAAKYISLRKYKVVATGIVLACQGKLQTSHGYKWRYENFKLISPK